MGEQTRKIKSMVSKIIEEEEQSNTETNKVVEDLLGPTNGGETENSQIPTLANSSVTKPVNESTNCNPQPSSTSDWATIFNPQPPT